MKHFQLFEQFLNEAKPRRLGFFGQTARDLYSKITALSHYYTVKKGEKALVYINGEKYWVTDLDELKNDPTAKTVILTDKRGEEVEFDIVDIEEIEMGILN